MKYRVLLTLFCFAFLKLNAQKLTLNNLENICNQPNWEGVNQFLMNKNWEYYESSKGDSEKYNTITWSFNKSYDDKAAAWFYLYTYEGFPNKISYSVFNKPSYTIIQKALSSKGYKLQNSEIEDNELISIYANSKFLLTITTEKREKDDYSSFDESITAYGFQLIKKSSVYDPDNGRKTQYYANSDQIKSEYTLKNGKYEGSYKRYFENGTLKFEGNYINDKKSGLWKEYDDQSNLSATYTMRNGGLEGIAKIYEDNKLKKENRFRKDKLDGVCKTYYYGEEDEVLAIEKISFVNGVRHGTSQIVYIDEENGERILNYTEYVEGSKNGAFQDFKGDSLIFGNYKDDKLNGPYKLYRDLNKLIFGGIIKTDTTKLELIDLGQFRAGKKTGYWKHYTLLGGLSEGSYQNDLKTGKWKYYYSKYMDENNKPFPYSQELYAIENYIQGKLNGPSEYLSKLSKTRYKCDERDENNKPKDSCTKMVYAKIQQLVNYKNDERNGLYTSRDSLNQIIFQGNYENDKKNGPWLESYLKFDLNQQPYYSYQEGNYSDGDRVGEWIQYLEKGKTLIKCNYKYGQLSGDFTSYREDGTIEELKTFKYDKLVSLDVYDEQGQLLTESYKISNETNSKVKVRYTNYFEDRSKMVLDYTILKPEKDIDHYDFRDVFHTQLQIEGKHYQDGEVLLTNTDGSISIKGFMYKKAKTGTWEFHYPMQNVKIITTYIDQSNTPNSETYYTIDTDELFNGEFVYHDEETEGTEERRIRDGLRNGNTIYFNKAGDKVKKEKYKDGKLKD